jgi:MASE9 protein
VSRLAKSYLATVIVAGAAVLSYGLAHWRADDLDRFTVFLALFGIAATLKGKVPGVTGSYSPVFFFALLGSAMLSFGEVAVASALAGAVQCMVRQEHRPTLVRVAFNASNLVLSTAAGFVFIERLLPGLDKQPQLLCFLLGASVFYLVNTGLVSLALTLVEGGSLSNIWNHWCLGSLPFYLVGSLIVAATLSASSAATFVGVILVAPPMLLATIYYRLWLRNGKED